ncbi:MAG: hypothetical protein JXQ75_01635 [Phycisphaerae bacterium]|nr:hypothetical protein [Phycisphaerae bacterium]
MKISASIELVMQLAGQEAIAGKFKEIAPEHLLMGLLKLADLPVDEVGKIAPGSDVVEQLVSEMKSLRHALDARGVDTARARRGLRAALGKGDHKYEGGAVHRSAESRKLFDAAVRLMVEGGSEAFSVTHLLETILAAPTPAMVRELGDVAKDGHGEPAPMPFLDQHACDLTAIARDGGLADGLNRGVEAKALLQALGQGNRRSAVLVAEQLSAARAVVLSAAQAISVAQGPLELKGKRVLDFRFRRPVDRRRETFRYELGIKPLLGDQGYCARCGAVADPEDNCYLHDELGPCCEYCRGESLDVVVLLRTALAEASKAGDVILVVPEIRVERRTPKDTGVTVPQPGPCRPKHEVSAWVGILRQAIEKKSVLCIWTITPPTHRRWVEEDGFWKRLVEVIRVHDRADGEVPWEL